MKDFFDRFKKNRRLNARSRLADKMYRPSPNPVGQGMIDRRAIEGGLSLSDTTPPAPIQQPNAAREMLRRAHLEKYRENIQGGELARKMLSPTIRPSAPESQKMDRASLITTMYGDRLKDEAFEDVVVKPSTPPDPIAEFFKKIFR